MGRAQRGWTPESDEVLRALIGSPWGVIAAVMGRTEASLRSRANRLGIRGPHCRERHDQAEFMGCRERQ